jgi:hypothetical protein
MALNSPSHTALATTLEGIPYRRAMALMLSLFCPCTKAFAPSLHKSLVNYRAGFDKFESFTQY